MHDAATTRDAGQAAGEPPILSRPVRPLELRRVALAILLSYLTLVGLIVLGTVTLVSRDRQQELRRAEVELASLARALDEHVTRTFGQVDTVLEAISTRIGTGGGPQLFGERALHQVSSEWLAKTPQALLLATGLDDGSIFSDTRAYPAEQGVFLDSAMLAWLRADTPPEARIGRPYRLASDGQWIIPVVRRILSPEGKPKGFSAAGVAPDYFRAFYRDIHLSEDDAISLLTNDGILLMRLPSDDGQIGRDFSGNPPLANPLAHETRIATGLTWIDRRIRISAARSIAGYPLVIRVSRPVDTALTSFRANTQRVIWGVVLLCGVLGLLAWVIFEDIKRRERSRSMLQKLALSLEERVRQRTGELEHSNRELLAFSYSVSHDLRAPLRAINGFSHALLDDYAGQLDATGRDYLERVARASVRMGELIDELLKLANVARQPLELRQVDLSTMVRDIADDLRAGSPGRNVSWNIQPGIAALVDETLIRNLFGNLLDNAWKFTRERSEAVISFGAREGDEATHFWISDNGIGFDMTYAGRLFQPFQQLHTGLGYKGTGIGLASARRIIERHGGKIWAESRTGEGTTILFTLPRPAAVIRKRRR